MDVIAVWHTHRSNSLHQTASVIENSEQHFRRWEAALRSSRLNDASAPTTDINFFRPITDLPSREKVASGSQQIPHLRRSSQRCHRLGTRISPD